MDISAPDRVEPLFADPAPPLGLSPRVPGRLSRDAVGALAASADLPPPRRKLLEGLGLLWHDHWEAAHAVAQSHEGQADHDLLHGLVHRREGDLANAEYWFRSAGRHPCQALLEADAAALLADAGAGDLRAALLPAGRWSSKAFLAELRRAGVLSGKDTDRLVSLQALEFRAFARWLRGAA